MKTAATSLLITIGRYLDRTGMTATALGRAAANDPGFVHGLRNGRTPRAKMVARVNAYMADNPAPLTGFRLREQRRAERIEQGRADARAWRVRMRPYFDALYGPDEWAEDRRLGPSRKQGASVALKAAA